MRTSAHTASHTCIHYKHTLICTHCHSHTAWSWGFEAALWNLITKSPWTTDSPLLSPIRFNSLQYRELQRFSMSPLSTYKCAAEFMWLTSVSFSRTKRFPWMRLNTSAPRLWMVMEKLWGGREDGRAAAHLIEVKLGSAWETKEEGLRKTLSEEGEGCWRAQ